MISRTGQAVALMRASMSRPYTQDGDPDAQVRMVAGMTPIRTVRAGIAARTQFFDAQVLAALNRGVRQVVVCGAGYDDRALRFRTPGVRFFELDQPSTQADKRARLTAFGADTSGLTFVPADFRLDDVADVLTRAGHDANLPSVILTEGLLVYLTRADGAQLLGGLRRCAGPGSTLVASLGLAPVGMSPQTAVAVANARRRNGVDEPWVTILAREDYLEELRRCGWDPRVTRDAADLEPTAPRDKACLVAASPLDPA
ncbi:MAG TPA: SAM-dependent methyltransferase [Micromonosporaceae bacterium]|jgi:methyltransferase (TIGR00027 family)